MSDPCYLGHNLFYHIKVMQQILYPWLNFLKTKLYSFLLCVYKLQQLGSISPVLEHYLNNCLPLN